MAATVHPGSIKRAGAIQGASHQAGILKVSMRASILNNDHCDRCGQGMAKGHEQGLRWALLLKTSSCTQCQHQERTHAPIVHQQILSQSVTDSALLAIIYTRYTRVQMHVRIIQDRPGV